MLSETERDKWLFQQGAWLAARGEANIALELVAQSRDDRARVLSGLLWLVVKREAQVAAT